MEKVTGEPRHTLDNCGVAAGGATEALIEGGR